jgi:hypothetical protein
LAHGFGSQANHVEAAHQIDHDGFAEGGQRVRAIFADCFFSRGNACAVDEANQFA